MGIDRGKEFRGRLIGADTWHFVGDGRISVGHMRTGGLRLLTLSPFRLGVVFSFIGLEAGKGGGKRSRYAAD